MAPNDFPFITILEMLNTTRNDEPYYSGETLPLSYEDDGPDASSMSLNRSYYDDLLPNLHAKLNKTTSPAFLSFTSPFTYMFLVLVCYLLLTIVLLTFSLYKQRQTEMENFYFGDSDEEIERGKRQLTWKRLLIGKIRKGDMEPLLTNTTETFPTEIV